MRRGFGDGLKITPEMQETASYCAEIARQNGDRRKYTCEKGAGVEGDRRGRVLRSHARGH